MGLTQAERAKRYRENIKKNPEKYEVHRRKNLERLSRSKHTIKIKDLSIDEKKKRRKLWREQKRKQKEKKNSESKPTPTDVPGEVKPASHSLEMRYREVSNSYMEALNNIQNLNRQLDRLKMKLYDTQKKHETEVKVLQTENDKLKAHQEKLEMLLRDRETYSNKNKEKQFLKQVSTITAEKTSNVSDQNSLGFKGRIRITNKNSYVKEKIGRHFNKDDVSRCTTRKQECRIRSNQIGLLILQ